MRLLHERKDVINLGGVLVMIEDACTRKSTVDLVSALLWVSPELYHSAFLEIDMPLNTISCGGYRIVTDASLTGVSMR